MQLTSCNIEEVFARVTLNHPFVIISLRCLLPLAILAQPLTREIWNIVLSLEYANDSRSFSSVFTLNERWINFTTNFGWKTSPLRRRERERVFAKIRTNAKYVQSSYDNFVSFRFVKCYLWSRGNSVYRCYNMIASFLIWWPVTTRKLSHRVYIPIESFNETNEFRREGGPSSLTNVEVAELQNYLTCYHSVDFFTYPFKKYLPATCAMSSEISLWFSVKKRRRTFLKRQTSNCSDYIYVARIE